MKKLYRSPQMIVISIKHTHCLMENSTIGQGETYTSGHLILSRRRGSSWDDEDDE